jgi:uncharacterized membrane protein
LEDSIKNSLENHPKIIMRRQKSAHSSVKIVFLCLGVVTMSIAVGFAAYGLWLVLPYAGLECLALGMAYFWLKKQANDFEMIYVENDQIFVESSFSGVHQKMVFSKYWIQISVEQTRPNRMKIFVGSHGNRLEVGRLLPAAKKRDLMNQIKLLAAV